MLGAAAAPDRAQDCCRIAGAARNGNSMLVPEPARTIIVNSSPVGMFGLLAKDRDWLEAESGPPSPHRWYDERLRVPNNRREGA